MSYPQLEQSSDTVLASKDLFRLRTDLKYNGEIHGIDTSIRGLVIGPQSDLQNVRVYYFDPKAPGFVSELLVSVSDPFIGRLDARMDQDYPGLGTAGRIFVTNDDFVPGLGAHPTLPVDQQFYIDSSNPDYDWDIVVWHAPQLDLLAYHIDPPAVPIARAERQWSDEVIIVARDPLTTGKSWFFYPHYRRKYFHARLYNGAFASQTLGYEIYGVTFYPTLGGGFGSPYAHLTQLTTGSVASTANSAAVLYSEKVPDLATPGTHPIGYFDYILVGVSGTAFGYNTQGAVVLDAISSDWAA